jgi:biotin transport system substrate-specific component
MLVACVLVGALADRGYARSVTTAFLCCVAGSVCIFTFGLLWLSRYFHGQALLHAGLVPFIPGDLIKNLAAAMLAGTVYRFSK